MSRPRPHSPLEYTLLLFLFALFLLVSPLINWWADAASPWYVPYLLWGLIIVLAALVRRRDAL